MNFTEWTALDAQQKQAQWPGLSISDRDAIITADPRVLDEIMAIRKPSQTAAPMRPISNFEVLSNAREASCYSALRRIIGVIAALGYATSVVCLFMAFIAFAENRADWRVLFCGLLGPVGVVIFRQSSLLLIDLVDLQLHIEARRRQGK